MGVGTFATASIPRGTVLVVESPLMSLDDQCTAFAAFAPILDSTNVLKALQLYSDEADVLLEGQVCDVFLIGVLTKHPVSHVQRPAAIQ